MPTRQDPHGIGQIINEINREFNDTQNVFETTLITQSGGGYLPSDYYALAMALEQGGIINRGTTTSQALMGQHIDGTVTGVGTEIDNPQLDVQMNGEGAVHPYTGNIVTLRTFSDEVRIHQRDGTHVRTFSARPDSMGVAVDHKTGLLWVIRDDTRGDIQVYTPDGTELRSISYNTGGGYFKSISYWPPTDAFIGIDPLSDEAIHIPRDGAVDYSNSLGYTASLNPGSVTYDYNNGYAVIFDETDANADIYNYHTDTVLTEVNVGSIDTPRGVAVDPFDGSLVVQGGGEFKRYCIVSDAYTATEPNTGFECLVTRPDAVTPQAEARDLFAQDLKRQRPPTRNIVAEGLFNNVNSEDYKVYVDTSNAGTTLQLPGDDGTAPGPMRDWEREFIIRNTPGGANAVTIQVGNGGTINGSTNPYGLAVGDSVKFVATEPLAYEIVGTGTAP